MAYNILETSYFPSDIEESRMKCVAPELAGQLCHLQHVKSALEPSVATSILTQLPRQKERELGQAVCV